MKIDKFGKGKTLEDAFDSVSERKRKLDDYEIGKLIDRVCFTDAPLLSIEKVWLYNTFVREIKKNRLRRFFDSNYVLLITGLLLACSAMVVLLTSYDGNIVLFYVSSAANLCLCTFTISKSFWRLKDWLNRKEIEEIKSE